MYYLGLLGICLVIGLLLNQRTIVRLKRRNQLLLEEKRQSEELLANILPPEVIRQLKNKVISDAKKYPTVCVFFSDFKSFSQIAETISPDELVAELDYCFTHFDRIIDKFRLQKIKTIGDAYMCVSGLYTRGENHIHRMIHAALEIQQFMEQRKASRLAEGNFFFEARLGIHTGPVVAGIIGEKRYAFDVWGDTVNVAQQMENKGEVGNVNISGQTYEYIKGQFKCTHRGQLVAKNKKTYEMYSVDKVASTKTYLRI